jgi:hypothetical protein
MDDLVFRRRFIRAWLTSRTVGEVASRMGGDMGPTEAQCIADSLVERGYRLPAQPPGLGLRTRLVLTQRDDGDYMDRRGREAYRVGPGTPLEGPWACPRCGETRVAGFFVVPEDNSDAWFICRECVRVVD